MDPFNKLPVDPEWVKKVDESTKEVSQKLDCMVLMIAIQEKGKMSLSIEGVPESPMWREIASDVPKLLVNLAAIISIMDEAEQ